MNNIVYCVIRSERVLYEALCSIRSLAAVYKEQFNSLSVTVITDLPQYLFASLSGYSNVRIDVVDSQTSQDWISDCGVNMFRVKILALMYYVNKYKTDVLFVDSDTLFVDRLEYVFDCIDRGNFVMNFRCMSLKEVMARFGGVEADSINNDDTRIRVALYKKLYERGEINSSFSSKNYRVPKDFAPYNSGIIGFKYAARELLTDVLDLCDTLYLSENYVCSEEFAFSLIFYLTGAETIQCNRCVYHYFYDKRTRLLLSCILNLYAPSECMTDLLSELKIDKRVFDVLTLKDVPYYMSNYVSELPKIEEQSYLTEFNSFRFDLPSVRALNRKLKQLM